jgi:hypothetical protein
MELPLVDRIFGEQRSREVLLKRTADGAPVHSFQTLLADLATLAKNRVCTAAARNTAFDLITTPTALQQRAFDLLAVSCGM